MEYAMQSASHPSSQPLVENRLIETERVKLARFLKPPTSVLLRNCVSCRQYDPDLPRGAFVESDSETRLDGIKSFFEAFAIWLGKRTSKTVRAEVASRS
jgi:hypothetical protein